MELVFEKDGVRSQRSIAITEGVIAGWTGRNPTAVEHHIRELEAIGIMRPSGVPLFYRIANDRFVTASCIQTVSGDGSGEVEACLLKYDGRWWVGVGSDHTDRALEATSVAKSKQVCAKPIATEFWTLDEVLPYWDDLVTRSYRIDGDSRTLYQEGTLAALLKPSDLIARYEVETGRDTLPDGLIMLCGTHPAIGGILSAPEFAFELIDPHRSRNIRHHYAIAPLAEVA